jgi:hypothetical protein
LTEVDLVKRRGFLRAGLASLALPALGAAPSSGTFRFSVSETAGLRRFGYPVHTVLPELPVAAETRFRLTRDGRAIPAQFRKVAWEGREQIALDFNASPGPLESQSYVVAFGDSVEPGPEPRQGMTAKSVDSDFLVEHGSSLKFVVPRDLRSFLKAVSGGKREYLQTASSGLSIHLQDGRSLHLGEKGPDRLEMRGAIDRQGPLAIGLRFDSTAADGVNPPIATSLDLTFPSSKSWVETRWTVEDLAGQVAGLSVDLRLAVAGEPTLVDLGADSTVYGAIRAQERISLSARPGEGPPGPSQRWIVTKGAPNRKEPLAVMSRSNLLAEGWAHIMDAARCTAVAVADFGRTTEDSIDVTAEGRVYLARNFNDLEGVPTKGRKLLRFWFHFVSMPVQVGAATSPQAMLAPLRVSREGESR